MEGKGVWGKVRFVVLLRDIFDCTLKRVRVGCSTSTAGSLSSKSSTLSVWWSASDAPSKRNVPPVAVARVVGINYSTAKAIIILHRSHLKSFQFDLARNLRAKRIAHYQPIHTQTHPITHNRSAWYVRWG